MNVEVEDLQDRIHRFIPPPLRYACRYWAFHFCSSDTSAILRDHLKGFSSQRLLHWIEVLSLLGLLSEGVDYLRSVQLFLTVSRLTHW